MKIAIIGAGLSGLATSCLLAHEGHTVTVFETHNEVGGRAGVFTDRGFTFDRGPSWYLMPDVFERFFRDVGKSISDYLELIPLNPQYRVFFEDKSHYDIPVLLMK